MTGGGPHIPAPRHSLGAARLRSTQLVVTREGQFGPEWPETLGPEQVPVVRELDTAPRPSSLLTSS